MSTVFCCTNIHGYKNQTISHEPKFTAFMSWAAFPKTSTITTIPSETATTSNDPSYVIQLVKQTNYGPLESKRYFVRQQTSQGTEEFVEVSEQWLIDGNFEKLNAYKNFKCVAHNKFFEVNVYQKNPVNAHHWRANIARPAGEIDL
ncbi:Nn.00g054150.m01.CDS01 [Neocucurbitaria sp. VM-36]